MFTNAQTLIFWKNKISEVLKNRHEKIRVGSKEGIAP